MGNPPSAAVQSTPFPTYFTSTPGSTSRAFYVSSNSDPNVHAIDEANKQTLTLCEILSVRTYFGPQSKSIEVPVLVLIGDLGCPSPVKEYEHEREKRRNLGSWGAVGLHEREKPRILGSWAEVDWPRKPDSSVG